MKSKHFSMPGHMGPGQKAAGAKNLSSGPHHGTSKRQHHDGHPHGHPTQHGLSENPLPMVGIGSPDYGSMEEHGLSEGNVRAVASAMPIGQCNDSLLEEHGLQHVDYGELTGHNYNDTSNVDGGHKY